MDAASYIDEAESAPRERRPTVRSRYNDDMEKEMKKETPTRFIRGQDVYIKAGPRIKPALHQIHEILGEGKYQLSRHGTVVENRAGKAPEIYLEENLSPPNFKPGQTVYVKGERGVNPKAYEIHKVLDDSKYQLLKDGTLELDEETKAPKEYPKSSLSTHQ